MKADSMAPVPARKKAIASTSIVGTSMMMRSRRESTVTIQARIVATTIRAMPVMKVGTFETSIPGTSTTATVASTTATVVADCLTNGVGRSSASVMKLRSRAGMRLTAVPCRSTTTP